MLDDELKLNTSELEQDLKFKSSFMKYIHGPKVVRSSINVGKATKCGEILQQETTSPGLLFIVDWAYNTSSYSQFFPSNLFCLHLE